MIGDSKRREQQEKQDREERDKAGQSVNVGPSDEPGKPGSTVQKPGRPEQGETPQRQPGGAAR